MEAHSATKLFKRSKEKGLQYKTLIGDDDASTMARLHDEVDKTIQKVSDPTHTKRTLLSKLHAIKSKHRELTGNTISYIDKCFSYALKQNTGNPSALEKALTAIPLHMFGSHVSCDESWCGYLKDPAKYYHKGLPNGKDLASEELKKELIAILSQYSKNADKLSREGSSQVNESLHNTIGSKALKIRDYSSSESSNIRFASGVAQKNIGHTYMSPVMVDLRLSPGKFTKIHANRMETKKRKSIERKSTPSAKRRRLTLKFERTQKQADCETREGCQYQSGIGLERDTDFSQIPDAIERPQLQPFCQNDGEEVAIIFFDVETTGSGNAVLYITKP